MSIYQIIKGDIRCDTCGRFLAEMDIPEPILELLKKVRVTCENCGGSPLPDAPDVEIIAVS